MNFIHTLKLLALTLLYFAFAIFVPIPHWLQISFAIVCALLNLVLADAWAKTLADEGFWFWACFILLLIPGTRLWTVAILTIYSFGRAVWGTFKRLLKTNPSRLLQTEKAAERL
jgi:hypothetical protein